MSWFAAIERSYWPLNAPPSSRSCSTLFDSFSARPGAAIATTTFFPLQVIVCDFPYLSCPTLKSPPSMLPYETPPRISLGNDNHPIPQCSKSFDCKLNLFVALCTSFILSKYSSIFSSEECALVLSSPPLFVKLLMMCMLSVLFGAIVLTVYEAFCVVFSRLDASLTHCEGS